jgi:hypothetical protein
VVLAANKTIASHEIAASVAAAIHMHYEGEVVETPLASFVGLAGLDGVAVLAPSQGLVEIFPSAGQGLEMIGPVADSVVASGWRVGVVVPSHRAGEAHGSLRGRPLHIQSWWQDGDDIRFGGTEVP